MTPDEIDQQLDMMAAQAQASGDEDARPGLITLSADSWIRIAADLPTTCVTAQRGIHYRAVRVWVRFGAEDGVLDRREARERGHVEFEPLEDRQRPG